MTTPPARAPRLRTGRRVAAGVVAVGTGVLLLAAAAGHSGTPRLTVSSTPVRATVVASGAAAAPGAPVVDVTGILPGSAASGRLALTTDAPGPVVVSEPASPPSTIDSELQLSVTDETTHTTVYRGALDAMPDTVLCGSSSGGCPGWQPGEEHDVSFLVTLPPSAGNEVQGAAAHAVLTWSRPPSGVAGATAAPGGSRGAARALSVPETGAVAPWERPVGLGCVLAGAVLLFGLPRRRRRS